MDTVNGLPAHILLVHAVVVLLPLAAFLLVLTTFFSAARRRLAGPNALLAAVVLMLTPVTAEAGEWLEGRVPQTALLDRHTEWGDAAIWFALPIAVLAVVVWWRQAEATGARLRGRTLLAPGSAAVTGVIATVTVIAALAGGYGVYRIGDSGAKAVWTGAVPATAPAGASDRPGR